MSNQKQERDPRYTLAEYKQRVLDCKSRQASLAKQLRFWQGVSFWLGLLAACGLVVGLTFGFDVRKNNTILKERIEALTYRVDRTQKDLDDTRAAIVEKDRWIATLEQNISSTSKKLLEKMLKER